MHNEQKGGQRPPKNADACTTNKRVARACLYCCGRKITSTTSFLFLPFSSLLPWLSSTLYNDNVDVHMRACLEPGLHVKMNLRHVGGVEVFILFIL